MAMRFIEGQLKFLGEKDLARIVAGVRGKLGKDIPFPKLPSITAEARETQLPKIDLRQQTYDLLSLVREPSAEEKRALEKKGFVFLPIERESYAQVVAEHPEYFWPHELEYANSRSPLRDFALPVAVEVGLNPTQLALPDSFNQSQAVQLQMIADYSQELEAEIPGVKAIMLPVTGYAQGDRAYFKITGERLFKNYFARGLDMLSRVSAASAGRLDPAEDRFHVGEWNARYGNSNVGAVPAVVFLKNK